MDESEVERLLDGRLLLRQSADGHRAGTDAILLAAAVAVEPGSVIADVGAGVGTVGLALALRAPGARIDLIERDAASAALARGNITLNGCSDRVALHELDILDRAACKPLRGRYAGVVTNPPFYLPGEARAPADPRRAGAYVLDEAAGGHGGWLKACLWLLAPKGALTMIHRPEALPALLAACENRLGAITVRPVLARAEAPAIRILFAGIVGSRAPLRIEAPLVLHNAEGRFTETAEAIHRGEPMSPLVGQKKSRPRGPAPVVSEALADQHTRTRRGP